MANLSQKDLYTPPHAENMGVLLYIYARARAGVRGEGTRGRAHSFTPPLG